MDPRTILIMAALMMALGAGLLSLMHGRLSEEIRPAAMGCRIATLIIAAAFTLLALQDRLPAAWTLLAGNGMLAFGVAGYWYAVRRYYALPTSPAPLIPPALALVAIYWFSVPDPNMVGRIVATSLAVAVAAAAALRVLLVDARHDPSLSRQLLAGVFAAMLVLTLLRAACYLVAPQSASTLLDSTEPLAFTTLVLSAVLPILGIHVFLLMCFERIRIDYERTAATDELTGLPNRRTITAALAAAHARALHERQPLAVAVIDVDDFKRINDRHGHAAGDEALRGVAAVLARTAPAKALVGRHGGEEFVVVLPEHDRDRALAAGEQLRRAVAAHPLPAGAAVAGLTISVGLAVVDASDPDHDAALQRADRALYAAKAQGRDRVVLADRGPRTNDTER